VNTNAADITNLDGYQLRLPMFEGPLDVLLRLIERSQLAITDVSLMTVTGQFLDHVAALGGGPPALLAEFTAVAARLVLLKSRSLLPRPQLGDEEESGDDLVHQLIEYRAVKDAARQLAERDAAGEGSFARGGAVATPISTAPAKIAFHEAALLARALKRRLTVVPRPREPLTQRRMMPLRDMLERVLTMLPGHELLRFSHVKQTCQDRHELLTAFLAILVLVRRRAVDACQPVPFGEIEIRAASPSSSLIEPLTSRAADD
jgi:segregation and condensation protein A